MHSRSYRGKYEICEYKQQMFNVATLAEIVCSVQLAAFITYVYFTKYVWDTWKNDHPEILTATSKVNNYITNCKNWKLLKLFGALKTFK